MRALVVVGLLTLVGCDFDEAMLSHRARFERTVALEPTGTFHLENVNGKVRIEPWDRAEVRIEAEKAASNEDYLEEIKIEVQGEGRRVDVRTRLPRGGFFLGGHGAVEYRIQLPARARAEVRTVNGGVEVDGMAGEVRAGTVNGTVRITEAAGSVDASTVNGSIRAEYQRAPGEGRHEFSTTNGSVTIYLPEEAGGEFDAQTVNGGMNTDFPLQVSGKIGNRRIQGRMGDGKARFRIRTVNGSVKVLKAGGGKEV
jgi:DUF4097 and DUF4098 domain-containing protein YvlB